MPSGSHRRTAAELSGAIPVEAAALVLLCHSFQAGAEASERLSPHWLADGQGALQAVAPSLTTRESIGSVSDVRHWRLQDIQSIIAIVAPGL